MVAEKDVYALYKTSGFLTRAYLHIKFKICPLLQAETFFPSSGRVVDLGCGNGLFSFILSLGSKSRSIVGFDLDPKKILVAEKIAGPDPATRFRLGDIVAMDYPPADIFCLIDVLYLIPPDAQDDIIRKCAESLPPAGRLIIKEMDNRPRWKFLWNLFQETLAVKVIGFTLGEKFNFRSAAEWEDALRRHGFTVRTERLDRGYWYPHIVLIAQKN
jgi:SAM-dependent methyltransferase